MRRGMLAAMICAALLAAGSPIAAQMKLRILPPGIQTNQKAPPRMNRLPQINRLPQANRPAPLPHVIPPSQALSIAARMVPNAKPVGVKLLNNNTYAVTLRQKNVVTRVIINAQTGAAK
jgi:uncharacterized membrane protein YkoI